MNISVNLKKKTFTDKNTGEVIEYYGLEFPLFNGENLDLKIDKTKAQMIILSLQAEKSSK